MRLLIVLLLLVATSAAADTVALKDGTSIEGTIANSQAMRSGRLYSSFVSILAEGEMLRIPLSDVDYIIIGSGDDMVVIDPSQTGVVSDPSSGSASLQPGTPDERSRRKEIIQKRNLGTVLTIVGVAAAVVGVAIKMGDEELRISADAATIEKTYNTTNYLLMVGGGALTISGVALTVKAESDQRDLERELGVGVSLAF